MNHHRKFEQAVLPHTSELHRRAMGYARNNHADAEDLVQETLLKAFNAFHRLPDDRYLRAWLLRILRNTWISDYRTSLRRPAEKLGGDLADGHLDYVADNAVSAESQVLRSMLDPALAAAFDSLSADLRETLYWVAIEGLTYREAADILGVAEGTVMSRMYRTRAGMRQSLGRAA